MNVEHSAFIPLVSSLNGALAWECSTFNKYLAEKIATKSGCSYEKVMSVIKCELSFLILLASLMCIGESRSLTKYSRSQAVDEIAFDNPLGWRVILEGV